MIFPLLKYTFSGLLYLLAGDLLHRLRYSKTIKVTFLNPTLLFFCFHSWWAGKVHLESWVNVLTRIHLSSIKNAKMNEDLEIVQNSKFTARGFLFQNLWLLMSYSHHYMKPKTFSSLPFSISLSLNVPLHTLLSICQSRLPKFLCSHLMRHWQVYCDCYLIFAFKLLQPHVL